MVSKDMQMNLTTPEIAFSGSDLGQDLMRVQAEGSAAYQAIAEYLVRNPVRVTAWGIEELAENAGVSTATISRFVRDLGFRNYSAMRSQMANTMQSLLQPVEKLRSSIERKGGGAEELASGFEHALTNLRGTAQGVSATTMADVVKALSAAQTVYVMGFGLSSHLAGILSLHLQPFCEHVVTVVEYGGTEVAAGRLVDVSSKDVLVVLSFPRYAADVVKLTQYASDRKAKVVAITDSPVSPLAQAAHHTLFAPSTHEVLSSSLSAAVALIEALATALMMSNRKNVSKAARLTEAISAYLYGDLSEAGTSRRRSSTKPTERRKK
jgi:DNA-binding MurR/RpiR family transcriptional regulator